MENNFGQESVNSGYFVPVDRSMKEPTVWGRPAMCLLFCAAALLATKLSSISIFDTQVLDPKVAKNVFGAFGLATGLEALLFSWNEDYKNFCRRFS